ncbi:MAG: hypothetical protein HKL90_00855 [Elusimicrobia bacterium]|nr:hypothetical protein [Elusimicrobiota bacterium]
MKKILVAVFVLAAFLVCAPSYAADQTFPADSGPATIDVSKYPKEQQAAYKLFLDKCSTCHTTARAINSDYATPAEWQALVDKMRHKRYSGIHGAAQKTITDFLIYDSSVRKKDLLAAKLKAAAGQGESKAASATVSSSSMTTPAAPAKN